MYVGFPVDIATIAGRPGEFIIAENFYFFTRSGLVIEVPRGFIIDFASIPKVVQLVPGFDVNGISRNAAGIHDYLYSCSGQVVVYKFNDSMKRIAITLTRAECDQLFTEALDSCGQHPAVTESMYVGVRAGGWLYFNKRKNNNYSISYDYVDSNYFSRRELILNKVKHALGVTG